MADEYIDPAQADLYKRLSTMGTPATQALTPQQWRSFSEGPAGSTPYTWQERLGDIASYFGNAIPFRGGVGPVEFSDAYRKVLQKKLEDKNAQIMMNHREPYTNPDRLGGITMDQLHDAERTINRRQDAIDASMGANPDWWRQILSRIGGKGPSTLEPLGTGYYSEAFKVKTPGRRDEVLKVTTDSMNGVNPGETDYLRWAAKKLAGHFTPNDLEGTYPPGMHAGNVQGRMLEGLYPPGMTEGDVAALRLRQLPPTVSYVSPERKVMLTRQRPVEPTNEANFWANDEQWAKINADFDWFKQTARERGLHPDDIGATHNFGYYKYPGVSKPERPVTYDLGSIQSDGGSKLFDWLARYRRNAIQRANPDIPLPPR